MRLPHIPLLLAILLATAILAAPLGALASTPSRGVPGVIGYNPGEPRFISRPTGYGFSIITGYGRAGSLKILYLTGNPYDRGFEYGYLAAEEISGVLKWAYYMLGKAMGAPAAAFREKLLEAAKAYEPYIPQEYLEEMKGIADGFNHYTAQHPELGLGFNITYLDILMINSFVDFSCTGAVVSGNLTVNGLVISGTTIDAPPLAPYFVYVVERPLKGHEVAYFTAAGSLFQNGFNDAGLSMTEHGIHKWPVVGMPEMIRDRYVLQYADNVTQAISVLEGLYRKYGFSGYGDALLLSDGEGDIAVVEVSPYKIRYLVNPNEDPTWPPEDPFLVQPHGVDLLVPANYTIYYRVGYTSVLEGRGWIVRQGIYTLKDMVVGLPGYPKTWEEATTSKNYTWVWEDERGYLMAHYIYDKILSGEKLGLEDFIVASKLPVIGDRPDDDGAIWMLPQAGMAVILKGQASFAPPIPVQTFKPLPHYKPGQPGILGSIYNNTLKLASIASRVESMLEEMRGSEALAHKAIEGYLENITEDMGSLEASVNAHYNSLAKGQEAIMKSVEDLKGLVSTSSQAVSSTCQRGYRRLSIVTYTILAVTLATLGVAVYSLTRREIP